MAKGKKKDKTPKPRPDKYAEKVSINIGFNEVLQMLSDAAHTKTNEKTKEAESEVEEKA